MLKALVSREVYRAVITTNTGVHIMRCGGKYAGGRNITAQARCGWDRLVGYDLSYCIGLAAYLVE